jgi:hypothetical protein
MPRALKKIIPAILFFVPFTAFAADAPSKFNWLTDPTGAAFFFLTNFLSSLGGKIIAFAAFLVNVAFSFTFNVVNSPAVTQGFQITLTLANLGFVVGIIVIAVATIFRSQTYGVKRLLTSLIAMAILVNFGLVISGVLINLSDQLTIYFLNSVSGGSQNPSLWVQELAQSASPQGLFYDPNGGGSWWDNAVQAASNTASTDSIQQLFTLIFVVFFTFLFALALLVVGVMLLLRYFWLTFLLILLPLAWLSWVFPALKKHWGEWWQHFIKWTFFAPVLMFFLYLAVSIASIGNQSYLQNTLMPVAKDPLTAQLAGNLGRKPDFLGALAKEVVILGLIFGGLMAASKMGIGLAGAAINGAKSAGGWIQGATTRAARRAGIRVGTAPFRRKGAEGKSLAERTRTWAGGIKNPVGRAAAGWLARGATNLERSGTEKLIKDYDKKYSEMSPEQLQSALLTTFDAPSKVAILKKLIKDKKVSGLSAEMVMNDATKREMANFGQGQEFGNLEKEMMMSKEMYQAVKSGDMDAAREEANKFFKRFQKKDVADMQINDVFSGKAKFGLDAEELTKLSKIVAEGIVEANPALAANMIPKFKGEAGEIFRKIYSEEANSELKRLKSLQSMGTLSEKDSARLSSIEKALKSFDTAWANNAVFAGGEEAPEPKAAESKPEPVKAA